MTTAEPSARVLYDHLNEFHLGVDLGLQRDYTAMVLIEFSEKYLIALAEDELEAEMRSKALANRSNYFDGDEYIAALYASPPPPPPPDYVARVFPRVPLGTTHDLVAKQVKKIVSHPSMRDRINVAVDVSGSGDGAITHFEEEGVPIQPVRIVGGYVDHKVIGADRRARYHVSREKLLKDVQVLTERRVQRLHILSSTEEARTLQREMVNFDASGSSNKTSDQLDWRVEEHDDLLFALALAAWSARRNKPSIAVEEDLSGSALGEFIKPLSDDELFRLTDSLR